MPLPLIQIVVSGGAELSILQWISFAARAGHLQSISGNPSYFSDRFQLGGPLSVRSFRANSMGPRDGRKSQTCALGIFRTLMTTRHTADSLGGDVHWSAGVSLITDIPKREHWPVKTHLFVNAGRLDAVDKCWSFSHDFSYALIRLYVS